MTNLGMTWLLVVGYLDDRFELRPGPQYLAQIVAALIAILFLVFIELISSRLLKLATLVGLGAAALLFLAWLARRSRA